VIAHDISILNGCALVGKDSVFQGWASFTVPSVHKPKVAKAKYLPYNPGMKERNESVCSAERLLKACLQLP